MPLLSVVFIQPWKRDGARSEGRQPTPRIADGPAGRAGPGGPPLRHAADGLLGDPAGGRQQAPAGLGRAPLLVGAGAALEKASHLRELVVAAEPPGDRRRELEQLSDGFSCRPRVVV